MELAWTKGVVVTVGGRTKVLPGTPGTVAEVPWVKVVVVPMGGTKTLVEGTEIVVPCRKIEVAVLGWMTMAPPGLGMN